MITELDALLRGSIPQEFLTDSFSACLAQLILELAFSTKLKGGPNTILELKPPFPMHFLSLQFAENLLLLSSIQYLVLLYKNILIYTQKLISRKHNALSCTHNYQLPVYQSKEVRTA